MKKFLLIFFTLLLIIPYNFIYGQIGGLSVYPILNFSNSSRYAALGGNLIAIKESDLLLTYNNPSFITPSLHTNLALNFCDYFTDVNYATLSYSHTFKKAGSYVFTLQAANYGTFTRTDESGNEQGAFTAGDYVFTTGWGRALDSSFSIGANLKLIYSSYESYNSFGIATDVAASYFNSNKKLALTLLVKNIGSQLKPYIDGQYEPLPFDIQFAFSQRLEHLPVRYHITLHSLHRWNMSYIGEKNPFLETDGMTGALKKPTQVATFFDNFFQHFVFGIEILPVKYLSFQFAYNHQRHQEMKIPQMRTFAGFSYGFSLQLRGVSIGFSRAHFATGATPNYFTFAVDIDKLSKLSQQKKSKKLQRLNE